MTAFCYVYQAQPEATRSCGCIGPQNGDPVCPCRMPEYNRQKMADWALEVFMGKHKPRIRVPAISRPV